ncbi:Arc family DNA-binding protein [Nitrospira defluvii]|nr:Arc family DNA-binding protein [Nitrospira defluvii]
MPALTIKNIPDELYNELKNVAGMHRRSINSEVIVCLEKTLMPRKMTSTKRLKQAELLRSQIKANRVTQKEIEQAIHSGRP